MPSVGRGSVRTTRQGGPPSPLLGELRKAVAGVRSGVYRGIRVSCCLETSRWLAELTVSTLDEEGVPYVYVEEDSGAVHVNAPIRDVDVTAAACRVLAARGYAPLVWTREVVKGVSRSGLSSIKRMYRSEDSMRRLCGRAVLDTLQVLRDRRGLLDVIGRESLLRYLSAMKGVTVYLGGRPPIEVSVLLGPRTASPPGYVSVACSGDELLVAFPGMGARKYRLSRGR